MQSSLGTKSPLSSLTIGGATAALVAFVSAKLGMPLDQATAADAGQCVLAIGAYIATLIGRFRATKKIKL